MLPSLDDIRAARDRLSGVVLRTPLVRLDLPASPAEIWLKLENLQPIGSFKIRGAANAMAAIPASQSGAWRPHGIGRQHGAGRRLVRAQPRHSLHGDRAGHGAGRRSSPRSSGSARASSRPRSNAGGRRSRSGVIPGIDATFIHAFDDLQVMAGNGTIGLEILEDLPDVDSVVIPWGGGGLATGHRRGHSRIGAGLSHLRCGGRIGCSARRGPCSRRAGDRGTSAEHSSTASGAGQVFPQMLARAQTAPRRVARLDAR